MKSGYLPTTRFFGERTSELAEEITGIMGAPGKATVSKFSDGRSPLVFGETVRVLTPTSSTHLQSVNDNLMELCIMIDAVKRASARQDQRGGALCGYARRNRKAKARDPITAKLVADIISTAGADRVVTMDLHAPDQDISISPWTI